MDTESIKQVIHQLKYYNPLADEYHGEFIHKGWAKQLEKVIMQKFKINSMQLEQIRAAVQAVIDQGGPGTPAAGNPGCVYRTSRGRKCIVGHIIPDHHYHRNIEGCTIGIYIDYKDSTQWADKAHRLAVVMLNSGFDIDNADVAGLLQELQKVHDKSTVVDVSDEKFVEIFREKANFILDNQIELYEG